MWERQTAAEGIEIIIFSEVRQRQMSYVIAYMWNQKKGTNELYKTEI